MATNAQNAALFSKVSFVSCLYSAITTERTTLNAHSRVHATEESADSKIKPFTCKQCGLAFEYLAMLEVCCLENVNELFVLSF